MKLETFKAKISNDLVFYFKPKYNSKDELFYQVDGYQNNVKPFKMTLRKEDAAGSKWLIAADANISDKMKEQELDLSNTIEAGRPA